MFFKKYICTSLASQDHPIPEAAEDQGTPPESDGGLWPADGHVLHGERGTVICLALIVEMELFCPVAIWVLFISWQIK